VPEAAAQLSDPTAIAALTEPLRSTYLALFVESLRPVFTTASMLALLAFLLSFAIKEVPLRTSITSKPMSDPFQIPRDATSLEELGRIVARVTARENRWRVYQNAAARLHLDLEPDELWLLARIGERQGRVTVEQLHKRLSGGDAARARLFARLVASGMASQSPECVFELTAQGRAAYESLIRQREDDLRTMLADWDRNEHPDVRAMMHDLAKSFATSPPVKV
jgi:Mn-dependent DtxR family transcriptional regulator